MGYRAEKLIIEGKIKYIKRILLAVVLVLLLGLCVFSAFVPASTWKYHVGKPKVGKRAAGELRIHFLDVGQADCSIIELPDGKTMLVDGGDGSSASVKTILRYLNALKIDVIDYLLVSHADSDHCGGVNEVLKCKTVRQAYIPNVEPTINTEYAECYAALLKEGCRVEFASRNVHISTEGEKGYTISFLYPYTLDSDEETSDEVVNESSAVFWLDYQGVSALFMGDADMETETTLCSDDSLGLFASRGVDLTETEILKVGHHGSKYSSSEDFLEYLNVETAIISCGKNNAYGHPAVETLDRLQSVFAEIYRTDKDGHLSITIKKSGEYFVKKVSN